MSRFRLYTNLQTLQQALNKYTSPRKTVGLKLVDRGIDKSGKDIVRGGVALKESQSYPSGFGLAVVRAFEDCESERLAQARAIFDSASACSLEELFSGCPRFETCADADIMSALAVFA